MKKVKKWNLLVGILLAVMSVSLLIGFLPRVEAACADINYYSAEQYTEDDGLLQVDGSHSLSRRIKDFAEDVRAANYNYSFPELAQVVPRQYLESTEQNAEFAYNGKEYGFYLAKEGD